MTRFTTIATGLDFPEGPMVAADGAIWCSELRGGRIVRIDPAGDRTSFAVGGTPNGLAAAPDGSIWFCDATGNAVRRLDPRGGRTDTMVDAVDGAPLAAPNDLAFHPGGDLLFTCPGDSRTQPTGYVCRRTVDGTVERVATGLLFPNGICFSHEGDRVVLAETYACRVLTGRWSPRGALALGVALTTPGPAGADGVAIDRYGTLHTCVYGAGLVRTLAAPGAPEEDIAVPDAHPAGCCIDPLGRWRLIVTGAARGVVLGLDPAEEKR